MKYRSEIDGLRAVAVVPVVLFHAGASWLPGGFLGVDIFFVISGYLITTIILSEIQAGTFSVMNFYARRVRRILPALFFIILVITPFVWIWALPTEFKDYAQSIAAVSVFSSNFLFWLESGYFAAAAEEKPLLHTWSLAVEEQYYLLIPLFLMLLWRKAPKLAFAGIAVFALISLGIAQWLSQADPSANFYLLPSRAWELLAGSLCAAWMLKKPVAGQGILAGLGLAMVLGSLLFLTEDHIMPSAWSLFPVVGACLIILFARTGTLTARLLSLGPVTWIGLISYSLYLWHHPLFALAKLGNPEGVSTTVLLALSALAVPLAYVTWRFVEQPFRHARYGPRPTVVAGGLVSVLVLAVGAALSVSGLHEKYFRNSILPENQPLIAQVNQMRSMDHSIVNDPGPCRFHTQAWDDAHQLRFDECAAQFGAATVVFGDSHATDVYKALLTVSDNPFLIGINQDACRPHLVEFPCEDTRIVQFLTGHAEALEQVIYVQAGFYLFETLEGENKNRRLFLKTHTLEARVDTQAVARVVAFLKTLPETINLVWVGPRIEPHVPMDQILQVSCRETASVYALDPSVRALFAQLDTYLKSHTAEQGIRYISLMDLADFDIGTDLYDCDGLYWSDGDHWSPLGEARFGPRIASVLDKAP